MTHQSWRYPKANTDALLEFLERTTAEVDASDLYGHSWRNDEVLTLLENTRSLLTTGKPVTYPGDDAELHIEGFEFPTPDREAVDALAESLEASRSTSDATDLHAGVAVFDGHAQVACSVCGWTPLLPDVIAYNEGRPLGGEAWGLAGVKILIHLPHPTPSKG